MSLSNNQLKFPASSGILSIQGKVMKILLIILAIIVVAVGLVFYFTSGLSSTAEKQLSDIKAGNMEAAYSLTSKEFQQVTSIETFKSYVEKFPILKDYKSIKFTERKIESNVGYLAGTIEGTDGTKMKIEYQLVKEDGKWKIQAINLSKAEAETKEKK